MTPGVCMRCHALTALVVTGRLRLCAACPVRPDCGAFQHAYAGSAPPGWWVCLQCGTTLDPNPPAPPAPPAPVVSEWDC